MEHAVGSFEVRSWDEAPYWEDSEGQMLARATVVQEFVGDIEGTGAVEYLMYHRLEGSATFVGMQRVSGTVDDRAGTLFLQTAGVFEDGVVTATWTVAGGTGALAGMSGSGSFSAPLGSKATFELDFELP